MTEKTLLNGKRILLVDDERDVLDSLEALLPMCHTVKADNFDQAKKLLETEYYDVAILDIMGVNGYELLEIANRKSALTVMLTARALSPEHMIKSYKRGAASYLPKEEMQNITLFLNDILEAKEKGKNLWLKWMARLEVYWNKKFGHDWRKGDRDFWSQFPDYE